MRPFGLFTTLVIAACVLVQGAPVSEAGLQTMDGVFEGEAASHQFDARKAKAKAAKKPAVKPPKVAAPKKTTAAKKTTAKTTAAKKTTAAAAAKKTTAAKATAAKTSAAKATAAKSASAAAASKSAAAAAAAAKSKSAAASSKSAAAAASSKSVAAAASASKAAAASASKGVAASATKGANGAAAKSSAKTTATSSTKSAAKASGTPANKCAALQGCAKCTANAACGFSKTTFKCDLKKGSGQITAANKQGCALMNQMQGLFQAVNGKSAAGVIPAAVASEFNHISGHVLKGEASNPDAGRHTKSAWLATHKNQTPTTQNAKTHILQFPPLKTVWDDGFYDDTDIKNMCAVSIALRKKAGSARASFVVQTPFGTPICVETFTQGTGSCFPVGTDKPKQGLGQQCGQGQD